ncbi:MAG: GNAT family N-acetyltransferase [Bacteroidales bacterium]|jgi:ribosomal protein S18 acetylase RimI-like enzyme|nr:GNAT family N-acetyltransferase [Bacteroidales bacterium]NLM93203.1 GNAT family N-acetyltransferase [Bacteroidales bacterium]
MDFLIYTPQDQITYEQKKEVADFLFEHLDEFGDEHEAIMRCINFAMDEETKFGGFIVVAKDRDKLTGAVVINKTGMAGYIPENILVYIAVHKDYRGKGLGKTLMLKTFDKAEGSIKLHVEPNNPARFLYEKLGFTNKYLEMRLTR